MARDAWSRLGNQVPAQSGQTPYGAKVATRAGNFYRLSVGGLRRGDADALCRRVKASGQTCFVRAGAGDALAAWAGRACARLRAEQFPSPSGKGEAGAATSRPFFPALDAGITDG